MIWDLFTKHLDLVWLVLTFGTADAIAFLGWLLLSPLLYVAKERVDDRLGIIRY